MNKHYLELKVFLEKVEFRPQIAMDKNHIVFLSEEGVDKRLNHRIEENIFEEDDDLLYPLLTAGASAMKKKLCTYAQAQLPGGVYWETEPAVKAILEKLRPNNDLCESILGLNDYLTTAIPNLDQMSRSNLIQIKKKKTMQWFHKLPSNQHELAVKRRAEVANLYKQEEAQRSEQRREKMVREKCRRDALEKRTAKEKERLSALHLITTTDELKRVLSEIDDEAISAKKKGKKKLVVIREQINIRKKVLMQKVKIPFTQKGRQRPLNDIIREITDFIKNSQSDSSNGHSPDFLVGKEVRHRFEVDGEEKWYDGYIVGYNAVTQ